MKLAYKKGRSLLMPCLNLRRKSSTRFSMFSKERSTGQMTGSAPVYLNVYDLTPINGYVYWAGLGIFHSGVEVHGVEYAFGAHDYSISGVFEVEPRQCPGFRFRKSIFVGTTSLDPIQVREFMELQSVNYNGDTYHLIIKNCNHFCEDICFKLTGNPIPKWVNRLARIGAVCNCILPESLKISAVHQDPDCQPEEEESEKRRLTGPLGCFSSISLCPRQLSTSSLFIRSPPKADSANSNWDLARSSSVRLKDN
ncbi:hypothetical protein LUZ60_006502 [Juncus effusus]|nr:hypothetical protein LUZ60_006502 [Juncus effusus]